MLATAGLGTGITYAIVAGSASDVPRLFAASLVYLPATLVAIGVAVAPFLHVPKLPAAPFEVLPVLLLTLVAAALVAAGAAGFRARDLRA